MISTSSASHHGKAVKHTLWRITLIEAIPLLASEFLCETAVFDPKR
jgi:hypothetical protein